MDNNYINELRARGFRMTPQRMQILSILNNSACHLTPLEIYQQAKEVMPGITEATVYRTLNFLYEQGLVLAAHVGYGQIVYEIADREHHHLICRQCGQATEINHDLLANLYQQFQSDTGYQIDSMHVTFFGLCPNCQNSSDQSE